MFEWVYPKPRISGKRNAGVRNRAKYESATVDWRFTTADARIKLKKLYPVIHSEEKAENVKETLPIKA